MGTTAIPSKGATTDARVGQVDLKLEVVTIPVSDIDRAKEFYGGLGWRLDADFSDGGDRAVQFTPPGSPCSIHFGTHARGPAQGLFLNLRERLALTEGRGGFAVDPERPMALVRSPTSTRKTLRGGGFFASAMRHG